MTVKLLDRLTRVKMEMSMRIRLTTLPETCIISHVHFSLLSDINEWDCCQGTLAIFRQQ